MSTVPEGFLDFNAKPLPAHERTLERLRYWASRDLSLLTEGEFSAVVRELCFRVCGVEIHLGEVSNAPFEMIEQLEVIKRSCSPGNEPFVMLDGTIDWLRRTYP